MAGTTTRARKPTATPDQLVSGDAVTLADGGEALVIGIDGVDALLRCGSLHDIPLRVAVDQLSKVDSDVETERHYRFRYEARRRGELARG